MKFSINIHLTIYVSFIRITFELILGCDALNGHKLTKLSKRENFRATSDHNSEFSEIERRIKLINLRNCGLKPATNYVINGTNAFRNRYPFMVTIQFERNHMCGGAILNQWWIITAAHCFEVFKPLYWNHTDHIVGNFSIIAGAHNVSDVGQQYKIAHIISHVKFNMSFLLADIALLRVNKPIEFNKNVNSICLPTKPYSDPFGALTSIGWGRTHYDNRNTAEILQKTELPIISDQQCVNTFFDYSEHVTIFRSNLCAHTSRSGGCQGDSGGPAFQYINGRAVLVGIVSFGGYNCDTKLFPTAYTQVSYFLDWIAYHMLYKPKPSPRH